MIPVWEYAKQKGLPKQTVYRWIREGKLRAKTVKKTVERLFVALD